jgi:hypothetical protein
MSDGYDPAAAEAALDDVESTTKAHRRATKLTADERTIGIISGLRQIMCTKREAAQVLHVGVNTFDRFLADNPEAADAWEDGEGIGKMSLRRKQFKLADRSAIMGIFLGKNYLDQADKTEHAGPGGGPIPVRFDRMTDAQLASFLTRIDAAIVARGGGEDSERSEAPEDE